MKELRRRVTIARRTIRQIGEELTAIKLLPVEWHALAEDVAALVTEARKAPFRRADADRPVARTTVGEGARPSASSVQTCE